MIGWRRNGWLLLLTSLTLTLSCAEAPEPPAPQKLVQQHAEPQALHVGDLVLGDLTSGELQGARSVQTWGFRLTGAASIALRTQAAEGGAELDTRLSLQRREGRGWGPPFARNDDAPHTRFSELLRRLGRGEYRVQVEGYDRSVRGAFVLASRCEGQGCPARLPQCVFGGTFRELRDSAAFEAPTRERLGPEQASNQSPAQAVQLLTAVQVAYEDAADLAAAFEAVDENELNRYTLREIDGRRSFVVIEYGAGDNSYGAVFEGESALPAAEIHDGDLYECTLTGTPRGARAGADCGGSWGMTCDFGLGCVDFDPERGAGRCSAR